MYSFLDGLQCAYNSNKSKYENRMTKECETCIKRKTMWCPTSMDCMALDELPYYLDKILALEKIDDLEQENKKEKGRVEVLENTLREILHLCNHLHNDCKYRLNDGYIRKIRNICKKALNEESEVKENDENI